MGKIAEFKTSLGLFDATMIVAGSMIGSGIFIISADMLKDLGSAGWLLAAWLIAGVMTLIAALCYGELSGMFPRAGGQYIYLKEAYNPLHGKSIDSSKIPMARCRCKIWHLPLPSVPLRALW